MSDEVTALFANDAFYAAFANRDLEAMVSVWSGRDGITCIHPGWSPLVGSEMVMASWKAILGNPGSPRISCTHARAAVFGNVAYIVCYEHLGDGTNLVATNVFVHEDNGWRMVHHQAGAAPAPSDDDTESEPSLQ